MHTKVESNGKVRNRHTTQLKYAKVLFTNLIARWPWKNLIQSVEQCAKEAMVYNGRIKRLAELF